MNDKEKQIKEMAIDLEEEFVLCGALSNCGTKRCSRCFSKYLYEQGYRKIDEGSEVVDRKVLEIFQKDEERFREKAKFYYEKCKSYGIDNFYDPELEYVDD